VASGALEIKQRASSVERVGERSGSSASMSIHPRQAHDRDELAVDA
jgi:hypothetical protein